MSPKAKATIEEFRALSEVEQRDVLGAIARTIFAEDYGELSDTQLTACASQTFAILDEEES
jgi:hypothetical protein